MAKSDGNAAMNGNGKHPGGAPKGSRNHESHGIVTFQSAVKRRTRRGRSLIDRRSSSGQNALAIQAGLAADLGGMEHISTAQRVLVELVGRDLYLLDETDQRIVKVCKDYPKAKNSPRTMATLYGYRVPIVNNISRNLMALGLEKKPPPQKSLEEILAEEGEEQEG